LKMAMNNLLLLSSILATVPALPPPQPTTTTEASVKSRTNGLINDVKEINLFLNIPKGCDIVYDGLIKQLEGCRSGSNHGDPRLTSGCLLKLDFTHLQQDCANTALFFPVVKADPTPPEVPCNGTYCPTSGKLIFSGDAGTNVAFPQEQAVQAPRDQVSIGDLLGDKPVYGSVFDEQRDGPRFG
jgi:hypothetical protein